MTSEHRLPAFTANGQLACFLSEMDSASRQLNLIP
jgi:hypothetical protein